MRLPEIFDEPSPAPWVFAEHIYGLQHCLVDRDGRVIASHFPISNGPLLEQAPQWRSWRSTWSQAFRLRRLRARADPSFGKSTDARRGSRAGQRMMRSNQTHLITARRSAFLRIWVIPYPNPSRLRAACVDLSGLRRGRSARECWPIVRCGFDECLERLAFVSHDVMGRYEAGGPLAVAAAFLSAAIGDGGQWHASRRRRSRRHGAFRVRFRHA